MDHLGLTGQHTDAAIAPEIADLVALAQLDNVSVKTTAAPCYSTEAYPYPALHPFLRQLYDAYGPERLFWGSTSPGCAGATPTWSGSSGRTWTSSPRRRRGGHGPQRPVLAGLVIRALPGEALRSRRLQELHPVAVRVLDHRHGDTGSRHRGRQHDRPTGRLAGAQDLGEVRHGDGPVPVAGRRADATGRRLRGRRRARPHELDVAGPAQAVHGADDRLRLAHVGEAQGVAVEGHHRRQVAGDDPEVDGILRRSDHRSSAVQSRCSVG